MITLHNSWECLNLQVTLCADHEGYHLDTQHQMLSHESPEACYSAGRLRRAKHPPSMLTNFYSRLFLKSILTICRSVSDFKNLQQILKSLGSFHDHQCLLPSTRPPPFWTTPLTLPMDSSPSGCLAKGTGASMPPAPGTTTASSLSQSDCWIHYCPRYPNGISKTVSKIHPIMITYALIISIKCHFKIRALSCWLYLVLIVLDCILYLLMLIKVLWEILPWYCCY